MPGYGDTGYGVGPYGDEGGGAGTSLLEYILPSTEVVFGPVQGSSTTVTLPVEDLEHGSVVNGGYEKLRGRITAAAYLTNAALLRAWVPVQVRIAAGEPGAGIVVWDGYQQDPAPTEDGKYEIRGQGARSVAADTFLKRLYMVRIAADSWTERDAPPFELTANSDKYDIKLDNVLKFVVKTEAFVDGSDAGVVVWYPGTRLRKIVFTRATSWNGGNFVLQCLRFKGPAGTRTQQGDDIPCTGPGDVFVSRSNKNTDQDAWMIRINSSGVDRQGLDSENVKIKKVKLYDVADDDEWVAGGPDRAVVTDLFEQLGYSTDNSINPATTKKILPVYLDGESPVEAELDKLATYEGRWWGVWERDAAGVFRAAFSPWGSSASRRWTTTLSAVNDRPVPNDDVYNRAVVHYTADNGRQKTVTRDASPDPLAGTARSLAGGRPRVYSYTIRDDEVQENDDLATQIGDKILEDFATTQWAGTLELISADLNGARTAAVQMRAGDLLTLTDWPGGAREFRVYETQHTPTVSRITVGRKAGSLDRLLSRQQKKLERSTK